MKTVLAIMLAVALLFAGCSRATEAPELAKPEDVVQSFKEALSRGKVESCLSLVSDDVVFRQDPVGLTFEGKEQIKGLLTYLVAWNFDLSTTSPYSVDDNRVTVSANMRGDHYKLLDMEIVRAHLEFLVHDGKIGSFLIIENDEDAAKLDQLSKGGIGIRFEWEVGEDSTNGIRVVEVIENSPAQKAGIKLGDLIVAVDEVSCSQMTRPQEVQFRIIGPVESKVLLTIVQEGTAEPINVEVVRADLSGLLQEWQSGVKTGVTIQEGNSFPKTVIYHRDSKELEDNRIGGVAETRHVGDWVWTTGLKWMRVICDPYGRWQTVDWGKEEYAIDSKEETLINDLLSNNVKIMLVLDVWYPENRTVFYKTEEDIERYLNYVRFLVQHFEGRIEYYEILNEPDLDFSAPSGLPLSYYVNLIKRTVPVIREADPQAKVVVGAIPDTRFDHCRDYMWDLLRSDIMPLADGFSWHGMYGAAPSGDPRGVRAPGTPQMANYWENYASLVKESMDVAFSSGFKGEYFVEEMLWRTPSEPHESEPYGFNDIAGAKYYARAVIIHLGLNVTTGLSVVHKKERQQSHSVIRNLCTVMGGASPVDLPVKIVSESTNIRHYGFSLPNGDRLLAIWTDGVAVDDDPGIEATVTLPDFSAKKVTAINVLHGFEQELVTESEGGNLIIRNVLVKDYPLILRLAD